MATDVEEDGILAPFSDRHVDVIVAAYAYPTELPPYDPQLPPTSITNSDANQGSLRSMMDRRAMLLAPAAVVAGDAVVPLFVHQHGPVVHSALHGHGWAPLVTSVVALLGLAGLAWAVAERRRGGRLDVRALVTMQTLGYAALEVTTAGSLTVVASTPLWVGLVVQLLLAIGVVALVRAGCAVVERLAPRYRSLLSFAPLRVPLSDYSAGRCHVLFVRLQDVRGPPWAAGLMLVR